MLLKSGSYAYDNTIQQSCKRRYFGGLFREKRPYEVKKAALPLVRRASDIIRW